MRTPTTNRRPSTGTNPFNVHSQRELVGQIVSRYGARIRSNIQTVGLLNWDFDGELHRHLVKNIISLESRRSGGTISLTLLTDIITLAIIDVHGSITNETYTTSMARIEREHQERMHQIDLNYRRAMQQRNTNIVVGTAVCIGVLALVGLVMVLDSQDA